MVSSSSTKKGSSSKKRSPSFSGAKNRNLRWLLGLGYFVQGFRCFPWLAVIFFLKDGMNVDPSTLQILQNSANLPMVGKPLYGLISDAVYISAQHRIPYIALGALLQALSWLAITLLSQSGISIFNLTTFLLFSNLGASIAEVANDAIVAETGKQPTPSSKNSQSASGELQSFVWMATSAGGILGNLIGGIAIDRFSAKSMFLFFGLLTAFQFFITIIIRESSLNLPKSSNAGIQKQLSELSAALRKPEIAYSVSWFAASYAIIPALTGTMFFYQTEHLKIQSSVLGICKVFGQAAMLLWGVIYNRWLKSVSPRRLMSAIQASMAMFMISDVLFVRGVYQTMGVPDALYVIVSSGVLEVMFFFKILPFSVLIAQLCPPGCEGSLMAFVMSALALAMIVSGYLGVALVSWTGVAANDFSKLPTGLIIQAVCTMLPILWSSFIPQSAKPKTSRKEH